MRGELTGKAAEIDRLLAEEYGKRTFSGGKDPLSELIFTILSQNTNDLNRDRAFKSLKAAFPDWDDVAVADAGHLAEAIRVGGLADTKARRILKLLKNIKKVHGKLNLDFLQEWPDEKISDYLLQIDGVGPKTVACVLAFSLGRDVMPVDTHVRRVSERLGILPRRLSDRAAHDYFLKLRGVVSLYRFHLNLIRHGRRVCRAQKPRCRACVVSGLCDYAERANSIQREAV